MNNIDIKNREQLQKDMLNNLSDEYEKTPGFLTHDLVATNAVELAGIYGYIKLLLDKFDIDNLKSDELTKFCLQRRGIKRKEATAAKVVLSLSGHGRVKKGDLFSTKNNIQFKLLEDKEVNVKTEVLGECMLLGKIGMVGAGSITEIPVTLEGIESVTNTEGSYDGFEAESDESLRDRYYESLQKPPTSGNIFHYMQWAKEITGVGDAKVFPTWKGKNTVKVVIIDADKKPASSDLVSEVQRYIDPGINGRGEGAAPIGAICTVMSAAGKSINIEADIAKGNFTDDEVLSNIKNEISNYLKAVAFSETVTYISHSKILSLILNADGVLDVIEVKINNQKGNIQIEDEEVAVLGNVVINC